jgi:hypothetical protein
VVAKVLPERQSLYWFDWLDQCLVDLAVAAVGVATTQHAV